MAKEKKRKGQLKEKDGAGLSLRTVIKRSGEKQDFDWDKVERSIILAGKETRLFGRTKAEQIARKVKKYLSGVRVKEIKTSEIRDVVEEEINKAGYFQTAKYYILYPIYRDQARKAAISAEVKQKTEESKKYFRNQLAELIYYQMYSRWQDSLGRRETWVETVKRFMDYLRESLGSRLNNDEYREIYKAVLNQNVMPSMRLLWSAGKAAKSSNVMTYNCSYIAPSVFSDFGEIMYTMMCGTGVGFSVEQKQVEKFPSVKQQTGKKLNTHIVKDSKEGWADALVLGMGTWFNGKDIDFDYSEIRPHGARLMTMGGRASGPEVLKSVLTFVRSKVLSRQGKKLTTLDVHDIICKIGEVVLAGGVRRNSMMSLSDLDDKLMRQAKVGQFYMTEPQRVMANNSAIFAEKPTTVDFLEEWLSLAKSGTGERGIFNRGGFKNQLPKRRWKKFEKYWDTCGTNPCGEVILRSKQFCNLTAVVVRSDDTESSLLEKIRLATILGTFQAGLTRFPYLSDEWRKNCEEEALLGVSFTGYWDNRIIRNKGVLIKMRERVIDVNRKFAKRFGIKQSTCVTCVKPSGNSSQLLDTASGMHPRYAKYYIRRVRISSSDPLFRMLKDQGVSYYPEVGQDLESAKTYVLEFPIKAPTGAIVKDDLTALEFLEHWKLIKTNFTEHNPSATVYVGDDEWLAVANWVYENWDIVGGLSFLPRKNHVYKLAPYEEISREKFEKLNREMPKIDFSQLVLYEHDDSTEGAKELACVGGACEI